MNKPLQSLTLGDLYRTLVQPLAAKIDNLENTVTQKVEGLNRRVQMIENELTKEVAKTDNLTKTVISMQRSLNRIDAEERSSNLMVVSLSESQIDSASGHYKVTKINSHML